MMASSFIPPHELVSCLLWSMACVEVAREGGRVGKEDTGGGREGGLVLGQVSVSRSGPVSVLGGRPGVWHGRRGGWPGG
jgi:hypothetical protein